MTYLARLAAGRRLRTRHYAWNAVLISYSVATTVAAIVQFAAPTVYKGKGEVLLICVSVAALAASLIVPGLNYGGRSSDASNGYRRMQRLSAEAERLNAIGDRDGASAERLFEKYQDVLDESENHTEADFVSAAASARNSERRRADVLKSKKRALGQQGDDELSGSDERAHKPRYRSTQTQLTSRIGNYVLTMVPFVLLVGPVLILWPVLRWALGG